MLSAERPGERQVASPTRRSVHDHFRGSANESFPTSDGKIEDRRRLTEIAARLDENGGEDGCAMTPSGMREVERRRLDPFHRR